MPNWEPGYCIDRSISNERRGLSWLDRKDTHCFHGTRCCWCGVRITPVSEASTIDHGKFAPKKRNQKVETGTILDIEPEHIK